MYNAKTFISGNTTSKLSSKEAGLVIELAPLSLGCKRNDIVVLKYNFGAPIQCCCPQAFVVDMMLIIRF